MGGPDRQTTPRTGLDDFVAGLLKYGTLGYLPQSVLQQFLPPIPGAGNPGLPGGGLPGGGLPPGFGGPGSEPLQPPPGGGQPITQPQGPGGPMINPPVPGGGGGLQFFPGGIQPSVNDGSLPGFPGGPPGGAGGGMQGFGFPGLPGGWTPNGPQPPAPNTPAGGAVPFDIGQFITGQLSLPQYGGQMTAGANPLQLQAAQASQSGLSQIAPGVTPSVLAQLFGMAQPRGSQQLDPALSSLLGGGGFANQPGANILQQLGLGGGPGSQYLARAGQLSASANSPLQQFLGAGAGQQQDLLTQLGLSNPAGQASQFLMRQAGPTGAETQAQGLLGGLAGGQDLSSLFSQIDAARQQGLNRDVGNLREQFSSAGAGLSTGLAREIANRQQQSQTDFISQIGQLGLGALQNRTGAAAALGGLGGQQGQRQVDIGQILGQLGLGGAGAQTGALSAAGQLGLGGQQIGAGAAQGLTQAQLADLSRTTDIGQIMQNLGLQAGSTLGQQGIGQAGLLSQILQGNQANSLSALQSIPGAYQTLLQAPQQAAASSANIGDMLRQIQQQSLSAQQAEYQRTAGALFPSILQYAAGAPQIYTPGIGQQLLGAGTTLGSAALGGKK